MGTDLNPAPFKCVWVDDEGITTVVEIRMVDHLWCRCSDIIYFVIEGLGVISARSIKAVRYFGYIHSVRTHEKPQTFTILRVTLKTAGHCRNMISLRCQQHSIHARWTKTLLLSLQLFSTATPSPFSTVGTTRDVRGFAIAAIKYFSGPS